MERNYKEVSKGKFFCAKKIKEINKIGNIKENINPTKCGSLASRKRV